jgi:chromosome segregation ATPase
MRRRAMALLLAVTAVLGACADAGTDESVPADTNADPGASTTAPSQEEAVGQFEDEIDNLSEAIASSESAQELSSAWDTLKVELAATVAALRAEGDVARDEVESALDAFEQELDAIDVDENVSAAWDELRSQLEQLIS